MRLEPAPQLNPHRDRPPAVDTAECFLIGLFLRRDVTYCARRHRYAQTQGVARSYHEIAVASDVLA